MVHGFILNDYNLYTVPNHRGPWINYIDYVVCIIDGRTRSRSCSQSAGFMTLHYYLGAQVDCTKFKQEPSGIGLSTMLVWAREYHMISGGRCHTLYNNMTTLKSGTPSPPLKLEGSETRLIGRLPA